MVWSAASKKCTHCDEKLWKINLTDKEIRSPGSAIVIQLNLTQCLGFQTIIKNENTCNELEVLAGLFWLYNVYLNWEGIYNSICKEAFLK